MKVEDWVKQRKKELDEFLIVWLAGNKSNSNIWPNDLEYQDFFEQEMMFNSQKEDGKGG